MTIRLQADADLDHNIVRGVQRRMPSLDFQKATEAGLTGLPDAEVLRLCAIMDRILVTHDARTMPRHFHDYTRHFWSPGVVVITQDLPIGEAIECIVDLCQLSTAVEWENKLVTAPHLRLWVAGESNSRPSP